MNDHYRQVPILALTANAIPGMRELFLEKGFNDYFTKPIDTGKLDALLRRWLPVDKIEHITYIAQEEALHPAAVSAVLPQPAGESSAEQDAPSRVQKEPRPRRRFNKQRKKQSVSASRAWCRYYFSPPACWYWRSPSWPFLS
jgi:response regulator of citrate/malate metabolism